MKSFTLAALALLTSTATAFLGPSCAWNNCMGNWQQGDCTSSNHWDCLCGNSTAVAELNSCVASSCSNITDQEAIYAAVAQLCVNSGHSITNSPEATFSATSGGTLSAIVTGRPGGPPYGWASGDWTSWLSACSTAIGSGWWGGAYPTGFPGPICRPTGVTGSWGPWTASWTWTSCTGTGTAITSIPTTMTMTVTTNGAASVMTTATTLAVQAQVQAASVTSGNLAAPTSNAYLAAFGGAAAAAFGLMVAL